MGTLAWIDDWFPSVDGIRAKAVRDKSSAVGHETAPDGILKDHKDGASDEFAPRGKGKKAGDRDGVEQ